MTLHWWMHWFWVTAQIVVSLTSPTSERSGELPSTTDTTTKATMGVDQSTETLARLQQSYRIAKAIGIQPSPDSTSAESLRQAVTSDTPRDPHFTHLPSSQLVQSASLDALRTTSSPWMNKTSLENSENRTMPASRIPGKKETKITWIHAFSKPPKSKYEEKTSSSSPVSDTPPEDLTVMPLQEDPEVAKPKSLDPNAIRRDQQQLIPATNRSASEDLLLGQETVEPHIIATAASILEAGLGDSTRLGRARGTFTSEFQREQLSREEHHTESKKETTKETAETSANVTEIATITGSCLAIIILLSTVGSLGFIMYRRKYLNPPQTLNSDKCSNPDSSGYIDDSTIRDNSEEMYSLDNDSFLNSLEAMTIQNYWTDSVKHTKL